MIQDYNKEGDYQKRKWGLGEGSSLHCRQLVLGVAGFRECDTFLAGRKTSQHLGHTEGICSHGLLGFISQPLFSDCLRVCLSLPSRKMQFVFQDPLTVALDTTNPLLSPCVCFPPVPPPTENKGTTPHGLHAYVHVHFGQLKTLNFGQQPLIQILTNSCLSFLFLLFSR